MEIVIGVTVYFVLLGGLMLFGKFLHDCDEVLHTLTTKGAAKRER
jgi:hypothetical protein